LQKILGEAISSNDRAAKLVIFGSPERGQSAGALHFIFGHAASAWLVPLRGALSRARAHASAAPSAALMASPLLRGFSAACRGVGEPTPQ
jgi:hypothetical protein